MTYPCIRHIEVATEAHHIREIFRKSYAFIREPGVHGPIFERINELLKDSADSHLIRALEELKEDIEIEIESSAMLKEELDKVENTKRKGLSYNPKERFLKVFDQKKVFDPLKMSNEDIRKALNECGGSTTRAARALGVSTRVLRNKLNNGETLGKGRKRKQ